jgi:cyclic pyranopterin phosphate synthase
MPREVYDGHVYLDRSDILTYDEITRVARLATSLGVSKVRLTGGEPLLRRDIERLVEMLAGIDGIDDLAMTTNALQLSKMADDLVVAGLERVTVSLDAIGDDVFRKMIDTDVSVAVVLKAIEDAATAGLGPVKINAVLRKGWNVDQVIPLAEYFRGTGHILRFIEYMDVGTTNQWVLDEVVTSAEVVGMIGEQWPITPIEASYAGEVAKRWLYDDGQGEIGFISSVSQPFCGSCTRLRLSAEGSLYTCLFATDGVDLRGPMRAGATDDDLMGLLSDTWEQRGDRYSELRGGVALLDPKVEMSYIGG